MALFTEFLSIILWLMLSRTSVLWIGTGSVKHQCQCQKPAAMVQWFFTCGKTQKKYTLLTHETCCGTIKAYSNTEENFGGTFFPNTVSFEFFIFFCVKKYAKERCCIEPRRFF